MTTVSHCPQCSCELPSDSPAGLCPDCLLRFGLESRDIDATDESPDRVQRFTPPTPADLASRFPQFEIIELLGHGGMGAVYRARQKSLDRLVALKIIKPDAAGDAGFADRFEREAKALARLNHSNIVGVHDSGVTDDGLFYFIMEYVDGTNLRRLIATKELAPGQAITIIPQLCEALQYAHDEGVVHRDIKPENILVDSRGRVKIADFGLAKILASDLVDHSLTGTHQVMGTPRYMAPEQMEGAKTIDHRADIYSLGVVFYEMLTGELPLGSFEPPSRKVQVDARLDEVVLRSLAKEPERRYQHASEVKCDVESISHAPAPAPAPSEQRRVVGHDVDAEIDEAADLGEGLAVFAVMLLFFGSVFGVVAIFLPWSQVQISAIPGSPADVARIGTHYVEAEGYRHWLPIIGCTMSLVLFVFTLIKTVIGEFPSPTRAALAAATGATLAFSGAFVFLLTPLPNLSDDYSRVLRQAGHGFDRGHAIRELQVMEARGHLDRIVDLDEPGCFLSVLFGAALIVACVLEMRCVYVSQVEQANGDPRELLRGPAASLRWVAWISPAMIPVLIVLNATYHFASGVASDSATSTLLAVAVVTQIVHALTVTPLLLFSASRMAAMDSRAWAWAAGLLAMMPLGVTFVFGLPMGAWALAMLMREEVATLLEKRTMHGSAKSFDGHGERSDWSPLLLGLALIVPLVALIAFGMLYTGSAWMLGALALPWFGLGMAGIYTADKPTEKAVTTLSVVCFLLSLGAIAVGIWTTQSAWPLAALAVGVGAAFSGMLLAELDKEEKESSSDDSSPEATDESGGQTVQPNESSGADEAEEEESSPAETLQWVAFWVGMVGVFRSWEMVSDLPSQFDSWLQGDGLQSPSSLIIGLTGPIILVGAVAMHSARLYWLAVTAAAMCLLTGSCLPVLVGLWSLATLFDAKIGALFVEAAGTGEEPPPKKSPIPFGYGDAVGSTLGRAWSDWWHERDALFTRVVQTAVLIIHVACLITFLGFVGSRHVNDAGDHAFAHRIGFPDPWYVLESTVGPEGAFTQTSGIQWSSSAWIVAAIGLALGYIYWRIEKVRNPHAGYWSKPEAFLLVWCLLSVADIGLAMGVNHYSVSRVTTSAVAETNTLESEPPTQSETSGTGHDDPQVVALMQAASAGRIGTIRKLLREDVDVNDKDVAGQTALMRAAASGQVSTTLSLVVMGANANERDSRGMTALMYAAQNRQPEVIEALHALRQAASDARTAETPTEAAAKFKQVSGVSVQILEEFGERAIDLDVEENLQDDAGETALMKACKLGDLACIRALAGQAAFATDVTIQDASGYTALMHLVAGGHTEGVETLIADRNWTFANGNTEYRFNRLLHPDGLGLKTAAGETVLQLAKRQGQAEIANLLTAEITRLLEQASASHREALLRALGEEPEGNTSNDQER